MDALLSLESPASEFTSPGGATPEEAARRKEDARDYIKVSLMLLIYHYKTTVLSLINMLYSM